MHREMMALTDMSPGTPCSDRSAPRRAPLIGTNATADFHRGAQPSCCNPAAVDMAAPEIMPALTETPLPRGSHPFTVRATLANDACGPHKTLYSRWKRWSGKGIFARMMVGLAAERGEERTMMIPSH